MSRLEIKQNNYWKKLNRNRCSNSKTHFNNLWFVTNLQDLKFLQCEWKKVRPNRFNHQISYCAIFIWRNYGNTYCLKPQQQLQQQCSVVSLTIKVVFDIIIVLLILCIHVFFHIWIYILTDCLHACDGDMCMYVNVIRFLLIDDLKLCLCVCVSLSVIIFLHKAAWRRRTLWWM